MGWEGLTVEPILSLCVLHKALRPRDVCINAAVGSEQGSALFHEMRPSGLSTFDPTAASALVDSGRATEAERYLVSVLPLAELWTRFFGDRRPNLISIDTEGFEYEVLQGAELSLLQPELILLEFSSAIGDARKELLVGAMEREGYELAREFGVNGLFERVGG